MDKRIKALINKNKDFSIKIRTDMDGKITATNYFNELKKDVDDFDKSAWEKRKGYNTPNFPFISKYLEGWEAGLYIFAGPANAGKTAVMLNIMNDLCMHNDNKLFGIYFSLDDNKKKIIPRIISMRESIPISVLSKPARYEQMILDGHEDACIYQEFLNKRQVGIDNLKKDSNKLLIKDITEIKDINDMKDYIINVQNFVKTIDPEMNVVVGIDSLKDIRLTGEYNKLSANEKSDMIAQKIKELSIDLDVIVMASYHLRKLNAVRRPIMDDLKDSNNLEYQISVCFLIYNDVSRNKEGAKIYYREKDGEDKCPVIEIDWAKNKVSSYKGRSFCYFSPEYSKAIECDEEATTRYNALIYEI